MKKYKRITIFFIEFALTSVVFIAFIAFIEPPLSLEKIGRGIFLSLVLTFTFSLIFKRKRKTNE